MKKIIAACSVLMAYKMLHPQKAEAWFSKTHEDITGKALDLLEKDGRTKEVEFYKPYRDKILAGCTKPDRKGDPDKGGGMHYYSVCNKRGAPLPPTSGYYRNRRGRISKSARTMLEENYTSALCLYKSGKIEQAMFVLARAAHFIEDMSCTVHVSNIMFFNRKKNIHNAFEKNVNNICYKYTADRFDRRIQKGYEQDSFAEASLRLIKGSARFVESISTLDPKAFEGAAESMLPIAQQNVMALLLKFYKDCNSEKGNYIAENRSYMFKNEGSGLVLTLEGKKLVLDKPDKDKKQSFKIKLNEIGAVSITTEDGLTANKRLTALEDKDDDKAALFRLASLGNRRYRITAGSSSFAKAVGCNLANKIGINDFDPSDPGQVWIICRPN